MSGAIPYSLLLTRPPLIQWINRNAPGLSTIQKQTDADEMTVGGALALGGSYYLTYHRWAREDQVFAAYPQFVDFLKLKRQYDPDERFTLN